MSQILVGLDITTVLPPVFMLSYIEVPVVPGHGSPVIPPSSSSVRHYAAVLQLNKLLAGVRCPVFTLLSTVICSSLDLT